MGRFVPEKRVDWLIKAFLNLKTPHLLVLAGGASHTQEYEQYLKTLLNKTHRVIFTGYVFGETKAALLAHAALVVLPSSVEGYPIVISEALSYHTRCLVPDILSREYPKKGLVYYFRTDMLSDFTLQLTQLLGVKFRGGISPEDSLRQPESGAGAS
jgi:glycosyltransferase involved in cell wall biosynthesis